MNNATYSELSSILWGSRSLAGRLPISAEPLKIKLCLRIDHRAARRSLTKFVESDRLRTWNPADDCGCWLRDRVSDRGWDARGCGNAPARSSCRCGTSTNVSKPTVRALRPIRCRGQRLFGVIRPIRREIRIWIRTAVLKRPPRPAHLNALCLLPLCQRFGFRQSPHTRKFYERTAVLYHHARGNAAEVIVWVRMPKDRWRIDWRRMGAASVGAPANAGVGAA